MVHTPEAAAEIIGGGCKPSWLREQARLRRIEFTFIAGKYGFTDEQCAAIVASRTVPPRSAAPAAAPGRRRGRETVPVPPRAGTVTVLRARQPRPRQRAS